jgi:uncharacterized membrane protein
MKSLLRFFRTTLAGGILFLLPLILIAVLIGKAVGIAHKVVGPLAEQLPVKSLFGLETPKLLAVFLLVLFCFLAGVMARVALAQKAVSWLESAVLCHLPGYEFVKGMSRNLLATEEEQKYQIVLARIEDAWQFAILIEAMDNGHAAIYVPGSPNPQSGTVYFMSADRYKVLDVPPSSVLKCLKRYGLGANELIGSLPGDFSGNPTAGKKIDS